MRSSGNTVSLVVPGRDCAETLGPCLEAVAPLLEEEGSALAEILFVDDGSRDGTAAVAGGYPVRTVPGTGGGPGAARNLGWRAATSPLVWFVDSDCVALPDALALLLPHLADPRVGGVGGSYGNRRPDSLLASLIHAEIVRRHARMGTRVDFLATFNVLYRRDVLEEIGGFDERFLKAQDAELSFRVLAAGHELRFEPRSIVEHHHETRLLRYLRTQRQQGFWRVWLHLAHRGHALGDSYSSALDHAQPVLACLALATLPLILLPPMWLVPLALLVLLLLAQVPLTVDLVRRGRSLRFLAFAPLGAVRAFWRGVGMAQGVLAYSADRLRARTRAGSATP